MPDGKEKCLTAYFKALERGKKRKQGSQKGRGHMNRFDAMSKEAMSKLEDMINSSRVNELLHRREQEEKKKNCILWVLAIIGAVAAVAGIAYTVYRFFTPDYLEDFEDDFDDDFDDDFFEDDQPGEGSEE